MSFILIREYGGNPEHFLDTDDATAGKVLEERHFTDGEELAAAADIAGLLAAAVHFDVRVFTD